MRDISVRYPRKLPLTIEMEFLSCYFTILVLNVCGEEAWSAFTYLLWNSLKPVFPILLSLLVVLFNAHWPSDSQPIQEKGKINKLKQQHGVKLSKQGRKKGKLG